MRHRVVTGIVFELLGMTFIVYGVLLANAPISHFPHYFAEFSFCLVLVISLILFCAALFDDRLYENRKETIKMYLGYIALLILPNFIFLF